MRKDYLSSMSHFEKEKAWRDDIIHYHLNQPYGDLKTKLDIDSIVAKYHTFPNEALYAGTIGSHFEEFLQAHRD
jgi:hypothetical protein